MAKPGTPPSEPAGASSARSRQRLAGPVEAAVRDDVEQLGDLVGVEPSLSQMAYTLAREIDAGGGEDGRLLPQLNRELRQTLAQLLEGRAVEDDDELGDLASPD